MKLALALTLLLAARPNPYLSQAKVFHQGLEYEKCLKRLDKANQWDSSKHEQAEIALYSGLCALALGREKDAAENFELALGIDPKLPLPPLQGPKVAALWEAAKKKVVPAAEAEPVKTEAPKVEPKAAPAKAEEKKTAEVNEVKPAPVDAPKVTQLLPASPPPELTVAEPKKSKHVGVPIALLVLGAGAGGAGAYFGVQAKQFETRANGSDYESDALALGKQARDHALYANLAFAAAGTLVAGAVLSYLLIN